MTADPGPVNSIVIAAGTALNVGGFVSMLIEAAELPKVGRQHRVAGQVGCRRPLFLGTVFQSENAIDRPGAEGPDSGSL